MPELGSTQPIIVIKKVSGHGGHHGGAWKVAYADFVTAMMALFIVLWLMSSSEPVKKAISGYFLDPSGTGTQTGSGLSGTGEGLSVKADDLDHLKDNIEQAMKKMPALEALKEQIEMTVTGEGLRIELLESEKDSFFERGSPGPSGNGEKVLVMLAGQLGKLPNALLIEGHTDSHPFVGRPAYSNWELSADRANAARRLMMDHGLRANQVKQIRGYADEHLRKPEAPDDASNRRISVLVQYLTPKAGSEGNPDAPKHEPGAAAAEHKPAAAAAPHGAEHK
jgi:chemotaxis protein MotB